MTLKVIFLAAGGGSRLGKITEEIPKPLIDINGIPMIERQIKLFQNNHITNIIVTTGVKKEKFTIEGISYIYDSEHDSHDQLGSLMAAREVINGEVIILFADLLFDENILKQILQSKEDIGIAVEKNWEKSYLERPDRDQAAKVSIKEGKITALSEKHTTKNAEKIVEFLGIIKLSSNGSKKLVDKYEELEKKHKGEFNDATSLSTAKLTDLLYEMVKSNIEVKPIFINGKWCEVDTPNDLEKAKKMFI